jgi:hypothetical protein
MRSDGSCVPPAPLADRELSLQTAVRGREAAEAEAEARRVRLAELETAAATSAGRQVGGTRLHCRFGLPLTHLVPELLNYSVALFLKRQSDMAV